MKAYTKRWFERVLVASSPPEVLKNRIARTYIKRSAQRAEDAFLLGKKDAEDGKPLEDLAKYIPNAEDMPLLPFIQEAYNTGYTLTGVGR